MTARPWLIAETTWKTVRATRYDVAVLPWGATEAHNYHLPYATDNIQTEAVAAEAARLAWDAGTRVAVLPCVPFGVNTGQIDIPLCLNLNPSTQALLLADIVHSLEVQGFTKLVILNGHGGNDFKQMIRELQPRTTVFLCTVNWWQVVDAKPFFTEPGDHAGELETSVLLHFTPSVVRPLGEASAGHERKFTIAGLRERWVWAQREWTRVTADTGVGNPQHSTAEKGAKFAAAVCEKVAAFLVALAAAEPETLYE